MRSKRCKSLSFIILCFRTMIMVCDKKGKCMEKKRKTGLLVFIKNVFFCFVLFFRRFWTNPLMKSRPVVGNIRSLDKPAALFLSHPCVDLLLQLRNCTETTITTFHSALVLQYE